MTAGQTCLYLRSAVVGHMRGVRSDPGQTAHSLLRVLIVSMNVYMGGLRSIDVDANA